MDEQAERACHQRRHLGGRWAQERRARPPSAVKAPGTAPLTHQHHGGQNKPAPAKPHPESESGRRASGWIPPWGWGSGAARAGRATAWGAWSLQMTQHSQSSVSQTPKIHMAAPTAAPADTAQVSLSGPAGKDTDRRLLLLNVLSVDIIKGAPIPALCHLLPTPFPSGCRRGAVHVHGSGFILLV